MEDRRDGCRHVLLLRLQAVRNAQYALRALEIFGEQRLRRLAHQHGNLIPQRVALELAGSHKRAIETLIAAADVVGAEVHDPALRLAVQLELAKVRTAPKIAIAFV